jgi:hypothetical protein
MSAVAPERAESGAPRLSDSLALIQPWLLPQLVPSTALPWLSSVARVLPPVHRAGFECGLAGDEPTVDLQQGIFSTDGEPARLARFLAATEALNDQWGAVLRLAERWAAADDPLHDGIAELWLEFDAAPGPAEGGPAFSGLVPSVFALLSNADSQQSLAMALAFVAAILDESGSLELAGELTRCAGACPEAARISHVGLMLGRSTGGLRVHVSRMPLWELDQYLVRIGWQGDLQQVRSLATLLLDYADAMVLCLDIVKGRVVRLGLESFFADNRGLSPRWRPVLERLTALGLCSAEKAEAVVRWPGTVTPLSSPEPWPEDLIALSLTRPEHELGVLERRLSHVKLSCLPERPVTAKVYFGYGHVWTHDPATVPHLPPRPPRGPGSTASDAIERAVDWLLAARHQSGWWRDFFGTRFVDSSDEWVTAYVGDALAGAALGRARTAACQALDLLLTRQDRESGWGYNVVLPPDGDATTWVLRLARSLSAPAHERLAAAGRLLESLTDVEGGVASYTEAAVAPLDQVLRMGGSYEGWCAAHLCISAPAAVLDASDAIRTYLGASQNVDGSWSSYWWDDDEYATAWAVQALVASAAHRDAVTAAVAWCSGRVGADGAVHASPGRPPSAFATALALYAIRTGGVNGDGVDPLAAAGRAERWLLEHQLEDGCWEPSARLRVPQPSVRDPSASPELIMYYIPDSGVWTTATVVAALSAGASSRR